ncbi:MAG: hypothetical protein OIF34_05960, partial [Porticoccaceae bacterium]|nr:hypothetical protein [Porticoccaceae bacterium]
MQLRRHCHFQKQTVHNKPQNQKVPSTKIEGTFLSTAGNLNQQQATYLAGSAEPLSSGLSLS